MKNVRFQLKISNKFSLIPYITGNCQQLGNWNANGGIQLVKELRIIDGNKELWGLDTSVPSQNTDYKYFLGPAITRDEKSVPVYFFEPFVRVLSKEHLIFDEFGHYNGKFMIEKKCLENENEYRLKILKPPPFISPVGNDFQNYIKCEIVFPESTMEENDRNVFVSLLDGSSENSIQPKGGIKCSFSDYITFIVRSPVKNPVFRITFSKLGSMNGGSNLSEDVGHAFICLESEKYGKITAGITSQDGVFVGTLSLDVLVIEPLQNSNSKCSMLVQQNAFIEKFPILIGHRGSGATFPKDAKHSQFLENTLESFIQAYNSGIKMIEFDVMLSKDKVPIIYHDYKTVLLHNVKGVAKKMVLQVQDIYYSDMTSSDFQLCKDNSPEKDLSLYGHDSDKKRLFPKLKDALVELPTELIFNVEVKYCMELSNGKMEDNVSHTEERNSYLNSILDVCFNFAGSRKLVFSSFDPDICTMLKAKQSSYPVMFLTQGVSHYEEFMDQRTKSVEGAINFATSESLFGIVAYSGSLLQNLPVIKLAKDKGLEVYCWGDENNDITNMHTLRNNFIDGIILDKIDFARGFLV